MFTHQFFDLLLNLDDNWQVYEVDADYNTEEVRIKIKFIGKHIDCIETLKAYKIYDHAPEREWRHLDTIQYRTFISCSLPRYKRNDGKILTLTPPWASKHEHHTFLFEHAVIDLLQATKNQTLTFHKIRNCRCNTLTISQLC